MNHVNRLMASFFYPELKVDISNKKVESEIVGEKGIYLPPEGMKWDEYLNPEFLY